MKKLFWLSLISLSVILSFPLLAQANVSMSHELIGTNVEGSDVRLHYVLEVVNMNDSPVYGLKIEQASYPQPSGNTSITIGDLDAMQCSSVISFSILIPAGMLPDNIAELQLDWFFEYFDLNGAVVAGPVMSIVKMEEM